MREAKQAIAHAGLIHELLDPNVAKFPREHAAAREIERLRDDIERLRADAERYRFHRAREVAKAHELGLPNYTNEMFDAYTDAEGK